MMTDAGVLTILRKRFVAKRILSKDNADKLILNKFTEVFRLKDTISLNEKKIAVGKFLTRVDVVIASLSAVGTLGTIAEFYGEIFAKSCNDGNSMGKFVFFPSTKLVWVKQNW